MAPPSALSFLTVSNMRALPPRPPTAPTLPRSRASAAPGAAGRAGAARASAAPAPLRLPIGPGDAADQAAAALLRARASGATRASVVVPLSPSTTAFGSTDLDDWPGGVAQMAEAAIPVVQRMLSTLKREPGLEGPLDASVLDVGDAVGQWVGPTMACVLFPTADTLKAVEALAEPRDARGGFTFLVNPQWGALDGSISNIVSDFGVGPWRKAGEKRAASFAGCYACESLRSGGDDVRLLFQAGAGWSVWRATGDGARAVVVLAEGLPARPTYAELTSLLKAAPGSASGAPLADRIRREFEFARESMKEK